MTDRWLVTPFSLDRPAPELLGLASTGAWVNRAALPDGPTLQRLTALHEPLAAAVQAAVTAGERPVSIAGDCCAAIPVLTGLQRAGLAPRLLWLDAHGDFNTPATSPSGFLGGMPLAMLVGRGDTTLLRALGTRPLAEADVLLCDARDLDPEEGRALAGSAVRHCRSLEAVMAESVADRPLHVHLDVDVLSLEDAPAMRYPVPGGPRVRALQAFGRQLASRGVPISVSVTTWAFDRDADGRTATACLQALAGLLGQVPNGLTSGRPLPR
jgi:arginase